MFHIIFPSVLQNAIYSFLPYLLRISIYKQLLVGLHLISVLRAFICIVIAKLPGDLKYSNIHIQELGKWGVLQAL